MAHFLPATFLSCLWLATLTCNKKRKHYFTFTHLENTGLNAIKIKVASIKMYMGSIYLSIFI